jgi:acyl-CoA synthetase (NDP forming)
VAAFAADAPGIAARLAAGGVPVLPSPERAVRAWAALWAARPRRAPRRPRAPRLPADVADALAHGQGPLPYALARRALEACGVRFCREALAATADEAVTAAAAIGYPVVLKADAAGLLHKTEAGGIRLDVRDETDVRAACAELRARAGAERFLVQERVGPGVELLVGARRDAVFGPVVALGAGGVLTEVIRDVSLRLAPLADEDIDEMLAEGARPRLLAGPRGLPAVDPAVLAHVLRAVSDLAVCAPRIAELDLNPVIAAGATVLAVDVLLVVGQ